MEGDFILTRNVFLVFTVFVCTACGIKGSPNSPIHGKENLSKTAGFETK
tara:strand:+ start:396 stop:542 length:147 start_codon:yes stop_codon:yes gene_type:complete